MTEKQASTLLDAISVAIKSKPINSDKQRKQLLNLIQSFKKRFILIKYLCYFCVFFSISYRFKLTINEEVMSMLTMKRKSSSITTTTNNESNKKQKKLKTDHSDVSNGDSKEPIVDCRQMPFKGITVKT